MYTENLLIDFHNLTSVNLPQHTCISLQQYLLKGWDPGGFLSAVLMNDMMLAVTRADPVNRKFLWDIGRWVYTQAPPGSWGSREMVLNWMNDLGGHRSKYANTIEHEHLIHVLKRPEP